MMAMALPLNPRTLQVRLSVITLLIVGLSLLLASYIDRYYMDQLARENFRTKAVALRSQVELEIRSLADVRNQKAREKQFDALVARNPDLLLLQLYGLPGRPSGAPELLVSRGEPANGIVEDIPAAVAETLATGRVASFGHAQTTRHRLSLAVPVSVRHARVGALYAEFWTGQFDAVLDHHRRWSMMIRFLAGLLIVLAVNGYLYFHVHRPLRTLRSGVAAVGSRDLTASVPVQRQDEIGELAGQFNLMVAQLRAAAQENQQLYQALKAAHDDLQQKVADATAELIRRNEELERLNEMLSSAQRETARVQRLAVLGQIVATVAHKIGTPLTAISGHVQLLAEDPRMDPAAKQRVRTILGQIDRMSRIVQDLLTLARKPAVNFTPVDMNTVLEQALNLFRPMLDQQRIELLTEFADNLPTVQGDLLQLQDVFANLIDNALEAMPDGGRLQVRTSPWISTDSGTNRVWVAVEIGDTGHGIAPDHLERVFEPFFTTKKAGQGTGLGLAIALESVQLHGGRLSVDSEVGKGSRFLALLPTAEGMPS